MTDLGELCVVTRPLITVTVVSATEIRVLLPINGKSSEWRLQAYSGSGCWGIWSVWGVNGSTYTRLVEEGSTLEYACQVGLTADAYVSGAGGTYDFHGGGHGSEQLLASSFLLDGKKLQPGVSQGAELVVSQAIRTLMPRGSMAGMPIGATTMRHRFTAGGVSVEHTHVITAAGISYRTAYGAMLPGCRATHNAAQCDWATTVLLAYNDKIPATGLNGAVYSLWHTDATVNPYKLSMRIDQPEISGFGWANSQPPGAWLFDRSSYPKWYCNFIGDFKVTAQSTIHKQTYYVE